MAQHSPEPWTTGTDEDAHVVYDENLDFVADAGRDDGNAELEVANARLIAAAPKLLAVARAAVAWDDAIHKLPPGGPSAEETFRLCDEMVAAARAAITEVRGKP